MMESVEEMREQLCQKFPFMEKRGVCHQSFIKHKMLKKARNEKLLVIITGAQGCGKTTFCEKNFPEYRVCNADEIIKKYLEDPETDKNPSQYMEIANELLFNAIVKELEENQIAIVDANAVSIAFRVTMLNALQGKFTKAIIIVLNPPLEKIKRQIRGDLHRRARPGLWEDVEYDYHTLQIQIHEHFIEMGVDDVYMV